MAQGHLPAAAMASYSQNPPKAPKVRKGTFRPQQWLLIGVQGCRLPGLKPSKPSKKSSPIAPQGKGTPTSPTRATPARKSHHKATAMAQGHPRPQQWLLIGVQGCRLPGLKPSKPSKPSKSSHSSAGTRYPNKPNTRHAPKSHHKATAMAQGHPPAAAMASYRRSRLPFARPQTLQNPPNAPKVRPAPQGKGTPTSPTRATPARKSHHKATAMAQGHPRPQQWLLIGVQGCRLPGLKPSKRSKTLQTLQKSAQLRREKVPQQA